MEMKHNVFKVPGSVFDVADALINKAGGSIDSMKLQKLVYYCQAWSVVWDGRRMFKEKIQSWKNGPVAPKLYQKHRLDEEFNREDLPIKADKDNLDNDAKETIDAVWDFYGGRSSTYLSQLTQMEEPWRIARKGLCEPDAGQAEIRISDMFNYYYDLLVGEKTNETND